MVPTHQPSPTPQAGFGGLLQCASPYRAGRHQGLAAWYEEGARSQGSSSSLPWDGEICIPGIFVASAARSGGAAVGVQLPGIPWKAAPVAALLSWPCLHPAACSSCLPKIHPSKAKGAQQGAGCQHTPSLLA